MNAQTIVAANVAARGYRDGWTAEQFVARQLAKLTEELAEAVSGTRVFGGWTNCLIYAGSLARQRFDEPFYWRNVKEISEDIRSELADMQVVLFAAAAALEFDVVQAAIDKSGADVARGVR